jgi:hypothetical protein
MTAHGIRCKNDSGGLPEILRVFGLHPQFTRTYDSALGSAFNDEGYDPQTEIWHSYKSATDSALNGWIASVPPGRKAVLIPHHEPENDVVDGYTVQMHQILLSQARAAIDRAPAAARARVRLAHVSSGAAYAVGKPGGPLWAAAARAARVDIVGIDSYQTVPDQKNYLQDDPRFQRWANAFDPGPNAWAIPEYGRMSLTGVPAEDAARATIRKVLLPNDVLQLVRIGNCQAFGLWWTLGLTKTPPEKWQFRDAASVKQWSDLLGIQT